MQRTENTGKAKVARRQVGSSTTLNRKYVRRPAKDTEMIDSVVIAKSTQIQRFYKPSEQVDTKDTVVDTKVGLANQPTIAPKDTMTRVPDMSAKPHPLQDAAISRMRARKVVAKRDERMTAKELKDKAIKEALASASTAESTDQTCKKKKSKGAKIHFGFGRVVLALSCAAVAVFAIVYFVNLNMPDVSLKVAAMQTGINATYPNYIPRDYALSSITSENKKIVLEFKSMEDDGIFTLTEEASSWDSSALLSNYVKETFGENYQAVKEQGLTIYISGSDAVWVNGGIVYKIKTSKGSLTNKQIKTIATSL